MEEETKIIKQLERLKEAKNPQRIEREQKFLKGLRIRLEFYSSQNPVSNEGETRLWYMRGFEPFAILKLNINKINIMQTKAMGATVLVLALGTGSIALASQKSLPGDRLYPVKILTEDIRSELTLSPESKAKLESDFAAKRIEEIKRILVERGIEPKGLDIAIENLQKNSAKATDIIYNEVEKGKDVSGLAKDIKGKLDSNKETLKQVFKEQIKNLKEQEKVLKEKVKEARKAGDTALVDSLTIQLENLRSQRETLEMNRDEGEDYIESESEDVQDNMKEDEKKEDQKEKAQEAINEAEKEKQELVDEFSKEKIPLDADMLAEFDETIAEAKDAFAKGNYENAKSLAKEAEDNLDEIEKMIEEENLEMDSLDENSELEEMDDEDDITDEGAMKNTDKKSITKRNEAFEKNASEGRQEKDRDEKKSGGDEE